MKFEQRIWNVCFGAGTSLEDALAKMPEHQSMPEFAAEQVSRVEGEGALQTAFRSRHIAALLEVLQEDVGEPPEAKDESFLSYIEDATPQLQTFEEATPEQLREDFRAAREKREAVSSGAKRKAREGHAETFDICVKHRNALLSLLGDIEILMHDLSEPTSGVDTLPPEDEAAPATLVDLEKPSEEL
jgi:hypothetical protein